MKVALFANTDWYLYNFRLPLAQAIQAQGHEVVLLSPPGRYAKRLEQAGFRWIAFPLKRRRLNPFAEMITVLRLALLYRRERPDLVHHFTVKCVLYGSLAAHLARVKAVVNALAGLGHVFSNDGLQAKLLRYLLKQVCKVAFRGTQVIFQNPNDLRSFLEQGLIGENAGHLIRGSGVNVARFRPGSGEPANGKRSVLLASRLLWAKGLAEYVEAARLVHQSLSNTVFFIAGETDLGNPTAVPPDVIAEWKRQGHVEILGHREDMQELLGTVDVVALPTYYGEGVPRILIEAAASGKPLIASDMPGCREIVRHGHNGVLVPPKDSQQLADAIKDLLLDDERRAEMGKRSRQLACKDFSEEKVIHKTLQVYQQALPREQVINGNARLSNKGIELPNSIPLPSPVGLE